jgi:hypothetical protein
VVTKYTNLEWSKLWKWIEDNGAITKYGYDQLAYLITCHMGDFNNWVKGTKKNTCTCDTVSCCPGGGSWCASEDSIPNGSSKRKRWQEEEEEALHKLEERAPGDGRKYKIKLPNGQEIEVESEEVSIGRNVDGLLEFLC